MSRRQILFGFVAGLAVVTFGVELRAAISVDGSLTEWGIDVLDDNGSDFGVGSKNDEGSINTTIGGMDVRLFYHVEDTDDTRNNYNVGPNSGGQNYDAEFLGVVYQSSGLSIAVISGQRPDNGFSYFAPGDLYILAENGEFGIEFGGSYAIAGGVTTGESGATYTLNGSGYTIGASSTAWLAGDIISGADWIDDPIAPEYMPTQIDGTSGAKIGTADYVYTANTVTTQHSIMELFVDSSVYGAMGDLYSIEWRPSCGNDELLVDLRGSSPQQNPVPEPSTLAIWGLGGLIGLFAAYRKRRKS